VSFGAGICAMAGENVMHAIKITMNRLVLFIRVREEAWFYYPIPKFFFKKSSILTPKYQILSYHHHPLMSHNLEFEN
jgi:hypothetical protein